MLTYILFVLFNQELQDRIAQSLGLTEGLAWLSETEEES